ncbi:hypothetical protein [Embleya sp. NPDC020630]|uniref:hypothetical protein n=1 Tax=Embleya sp. NPDC020630 TaxID=3363979 RepID=UPI003793A2F6
MRHGRATSTEAAALALQDHAALWSAGEIPAIDVDDAACVALVAGLDGPGLRILAACTRAEAVRDVHELLPVALGELGLAFDAFGGIDAEITAEARRLGRLIEPADGSG